MGQRLGDGPLHDNRVAGGHDDALHFGDAALVGLEIDRLHVEIGLADRDYQHIPADHPRAGLVPEGELLANLFVLVYACLDLQRAENELVFRILVRHQLAVVGTVGAGGEPVAHVVLVIGGVRQEQDELLALLARQAHDDIVRLHLLLSVNEDLGRDGEQVFAVVENLHVLDMVEPIQLTLDLEDLLWVADVGTQPMRHGTERLE